MQKILIFFLPIIFLSCASFNPGTIEYHSALTSPGSKTIDSVYVFVKRYTSQEAKLVFDTDFRYHDFEPIYISVFNRSNNLISIDPINVKNHISIDDVYNSTKMAPLIGSDAMSNSIGANSMREDFYNIIYLKKTELLKEQETSGVVFIEKSRDNPIEINIVKNDSVIVNFIFQNKSEMFFK